MFSEYRYSTETDHRRRTVATVTAPTASGLGRRDQRPVTASFATPTNVLKQVTDLIAPFIDEMLNRSLGAGHFSEVSRQALVTPVVKKQGLGATGVSFYRPMSKLSVLSKLLGASYNSPASELLDDRRSLTNSAVGYPSGSFDRNRRAMRVVRYFHAVDHGQRITSNVPPS